MIPIRIADLLESQLALQSRLVRLEVESEPEALAQTIRIPLVQVPVGFTGSVVEQEKGAHPGGGQGRS